jgi:broad specificity phosphatase PhoE
VFFARHGETEYETENLMDHGGSLTTVGRSQARGLGEKLASQRIAHVYSSTMSRAVQTAELAAAVLGVEVSVREGLVELALGEAYGTPAGTGTFVEEMRRWVAGDVDARYPGSESASTSSLACGPCSTRSRTHTAGRPCWSWLTAAWSSPRRRCSTTSPADLGLPNCSYVELEGDASGWRP